MWSTLSIKNQWPSFIKSAYTKFPAYTQNHGDFEIYQYGRWRTARSNPTPAQEVV